MNKNLFKLIDFINDYGYPCKIEGDFLIVDMSEFWNSFSKNEKIDRIDDIAKEITYDSESLGIPIEYQMFHFDPLLSVKELDKSNGIMKIKLNHFTNLNESKIIKESAKSITLKNIQKFVDEINDFAYNHYDLEDPEFTRKYGKLFDFRIREEGDGWGGTQYVVYDYQGSLDMFDDDSEMTKYIDKLASKYGWYAEPVSGSGDFAFGEA